MSDLEERKIISNFVDHKIIFLLRKMSNKLSILQIYSDLTLLVISQGALTDAWFIFIKKKEEDKLVIGFFDGFVSFWIFHVFYNIKFYVDPQLYKAISLKKKKEMISKNKIK